MAPNTKAIQNETHWLEKNKHLKSLSWSNQEIRGL